MAAVVSASTGRLAAKCSLARFHAVTIDEMGDRIIGALKLERQFQHRQLGRLLLEEAYFPRHPGAEVARMLERDLLVFPLALPLLCQIGAVRLIPVPMKPIARK